MNLMSFVKNMCEIDMVGHFFTISVNTCVNFNLDFFQITIQPKDRTMKGKMYVHSMDFQN